MAQKNGGLTINYIGKTALHTNGQMVKKNGGLMANGIEPMVLHV